MSFGRNNTAKRNFVNAKTWKTEKPSQDRPCYSHQSNDRLACHYTWTWILKKVVMWNDIIAYLKYLPTRVPTLFLNWNSSHNTPELRKYSHFRPTIFQSRRKFAIGTYWPDSILPVESSISVCYRFSKKCHCSPFRVIRLINSAARGTTGLNFLQVKNDNRCFCLWITKKCKSLQSTTVYESAFVQILCLAATQNSNEWNWKSSLEHGK